MQSRKVSFALSLSLLVGGVAACGSDTGSTMTDAQFAATVASGMKASINVDLANLLQASMDLQAAAPTPTDRGWDATLDATAIANMKEAWMRCRTAYEHIEGALAPIFPDFDVSMDARYDDFLAMLNGAGDPTPFDGTGVTGMHAIERILYAPGIRQEVIDFESTLPGYSPASFPLTAADAMAFKTQLAQRLIDDTMQLSAMWASAQVDLGAAFQGLVSLMNEQREKVNKAATGEEESRYSNLTLFDLRNNLDGTKKIYDIFRPWIATKPSTDPTKDGPTADGDIEAGFATLAAVYASYPGDAIPQPPATWSSDNPTPTDLQSDFGKLFTSVLASVNPSMAGSVVFEMNEVADLLGFPEFIAQ